MMTASTMLVTYIDGCCDILGIVKTLDLHLASCEGKDKSNNLQHHLIAIEDAQKNVSGCGATNIHEVVGDDAQLLRQVAMNKGGK